MSARRLAWLLCLGLMAVGSVLAHALAYGLAAPAHPSHAAMNHGHGESVFPHLEVCLAVCGAIAVLVLGISLFDRVCAMRRLVVPVWAFALVPPVGFVLQEHLEHALTTGALPLAAFAEPTFALGLVLQVPFALAAFVVARSLLAIAIALVARLGAPPRVRLAATEPSFRPLATSGVPRISALARGHGQRAPPLLAL
jgi:hypothetical protein